ncbi:NAD(P)/FAD-dependent oxidoreductase [Marinicella rhabdoformis]|uniref:NAD(P)/FAD-dependent oxidoreductase n=1 Tax=Marinicella rhabdoformis TaxID=2580566 RepID=UPI0012AEDC76|nr:FAD-dependent oxidoreductase [Marinicella rhabdoformis]
MKVAIIGGGISGMMAAERLNGHADYVLYEQADCLGGHANTENVVVEGKNVSVDTGFIVFNESNYPHFTDMLKRYGVKYKDTDMSFSVANRVTGLEYNATNLNTLFCQRKNLFNPRFWRMIKDILKFYKQAPVLLKDGTDLSVFDYFKQDNYSEYFIQNHILPMISALWSGDFETVKSYPLNHMLRFMDNHNMLQVKERPQWKTIDGGSRQYVNALAKGLKGEVRCGEAVLSVSRSTNQVIVQTASQSEVFDKIILASHSDQALSLLSQPTDAERFALGYKKYTKNRVDLHTDGRIMPNSKKAWASWHVNVGQSESSVCTANYYMNLLQGLDVTTPVIVSLNQSDLIDQEKILKTHTYWHPVYDENTSGTQEVLSQIQGMNHTYYCGAYHGWGFHEDGAKSGVLAAEMLLDSVSLGKKIARRQVA